MQENLTSLRESLDELTDMCARIHNSSHGSESENTKITSRIFEGLVPAESLYGGENHLTFVSFLSSLKEIWPEIPLNEYEAMKMALKYYKQSYREDKDITHKNQKIQAAYLIAELSRRVGDYQEAENYFEKAKRTGQDFIQRNQDDPNKIALAQKIVELATKQGKVNLVQAESRV
jgi:tetratricopeptide (TPR) repeat protein